MRFNPYYPFNRYLTYSTIRTFPSFFFLIKPQPPISTLFPYTTLFRSSRSHWPSDRARCRRRGNRRPSQSNSRPAQNQTHPDRKSTRLNSSHLGISYAVFCLKKKNIKQLIDNKT